jgi:hypothetical protein
MKLAALLALALTGCMGMGSKGGAPGDDAPSAVDASLLLPGWKLMDIQPASPRNGQTYGLDVYTDHVVVVTLLEGF